jgi:hypothetical protein
MSKDMSQPAPQLPEDLKIPLSEQKSVDTLMADDCRWPFGDPLQEGFHFCGKLKADGKPYCDFHMRRAFQAARPRAMNYKLIAA